MNFSKLTFLLLFYTFSCKSPSPSNNIKLHKPSPSIGTTVSDLHYEIWKIYHDSKGRYWFGTKNDGIYLYHKNTLKLFTEDDGLIQNTIRGIQEDQKGNILIETPIGISKYDGEHFEELVPDQSFKNHWALESDDLWFNCDGRIYRYSNEILSELELPKKDLRKEFGRRIVGLSFPVQNSSPYAVFGINKDKGGNIWFGTVVAGVYRYDGKQFLYFAENELTTLPDGRVPGIRSILQDKNGFYWLSHFIHKYEIKEEDEKTSYQKLPGMDMSQEIFEDRLGYFNSGIVDQYGDLWMTSYSGIVWKYDGINFSYQHVMNGSIEILIVQIYEDRNGVLWLGTDNDGVYKYDGENFKKFTPRIDYE